MTFNQLLCKCGFHSWETLKQSNAWNVKREVAKELNEDISCTNYDTKHKLKTRVCIECNKIDAQITDYYNKLKKSIIDKRISKSKRIAKAKAIYKIQSIKDGLPSLDDEDIPLHLPQPSVAGMSVSSICTSAAVTATACPIPLPMPPSPNQLLKQARSKGSRLFK